MAWRTTRTRRKILISTQVEAKASWARAAGVAYYLAFGRGTAKANGPRCDAGAGGQTLHALKAAGLGVVICVEIKILRRVQ